jgi:putative addiction module component (TIGR02574 family)
MQRDTRSGERTMDRLTKAGILGLSVAERILLAEDIWDSIAEVPEEVPLSEEQKRELDLRLDAYHRDPSEGSPWAAVRERIVRRARAAIWPPSWRAKRTTDPEPHG